MIEHDIVRICKIIKVLHENANNSSNLYRFVGKSSKNSAFL
jgi:hypothetical protein